MTEQFTSILAGRKTFFITPDENFIPESYLRQFMDKGHEIYIIHDDKLCPLAHKIELLLTIFKDSVMFFNIDSPHPGMPWPLFIRSLQEKYKNSMLGVLYKKRANPRDKLNLEKIYLYDTGITCGCIAMTQDRNKNFTIIDKVLYATQAQGRRKRIRAICEEGSIFKFIHGGQYYTGTLQDISSSHFSCRFTEYPVPLAAHARIKRMHFDLNGIKLNVDAMHRDTRNADNAVDNSLHIFVFTKPDGTLGLDGLTYQLVSSKIYELVSSKGKQFLNELFQSKTTV